MLLDVFLRVGQLVGGLDLVARWVPDALLVRLCASLEQLEPLDVLVQLVRVLTLAGVLSKLQVALCYRQLWQVLTVLQSDGAIVTFRARGDRIQNSKLDDLSDGEAADEVSGLDSECLDGDC